MTLVALQSSKGQTNGILATLYLKCHIAGVDWPEHRERRLGAALTGDAGVSGGRERSNAISPRQGHNAGDRPVASVAADSTAPGFAGRLRRGIGPVSGKQWILPGP